MHKRSMRPGRKVIHWELCKSLKFDHSICSDLNLSKENEAHKIIKDFEIQTDYVIPAKDQT